MEELFQLGHESSEPADINLCIFLHLKEFLVIDRRDPGASIFHLDSTTIFDESFISKVEEGFASILREPCEHPFVQFMDLPLRLEEHFREMAIAKILEHLDRGITIDGPPNIAVYVIGGPSGDMGPQDVHLACRSLLGEHSSSAVMEELSGLLAQLMKQEHRVIRNLNREEIREMLGDQSPNFFTLWERRN